MAASSSGGGGSGVRAGRAFVEISAKDAGIQVALAKLEKKFLALGRMVRGVGVGLTAGGAAIFGPLMALVNDFVKSGDDIADTGARLNATAETINALGYAAGLAGTSLTEVEGGLRKMRDAVADGKLVAGLDLSKYADADLDTQLNVIADAIAGMTNETMQLAAANEVFGARGGGKMLSWLKNGSAGLKQLRQEAAMVTGWTGDTLLRADQASDAFFRVTNAIKSIANAIAASLVPSGEEMANVTDRVLGVILPIRRLINANEDVIRTIALVGAGMMAAGVSFIALGAAISGVVTVVGTLAGAVAFLISPIGMVTVGLASLSAGLVMAISDSTRLGEAFAEAWGGIVAAVQTGDLSLAVSITWAAIKLEFARGIDELEKLWIDFKYFWIKLWDDMKMAAVSVWAGIGEELSNNPALRSALRMLPYGSTFTSAIQSLGKLDTARAWNEVDKDRENRRKAELDAVNQNNQSLEDRLKELVQQAKSQKPFSLGWNNPTSKSIQSAVAAVMTGGGVKGAFASQFDLRSSSFGDHTASIAQNTKETATATKKIVEKMVDAEIL